MSSGFDPVTNSARYRAFRAGKPRYEGNTPCHRCGGLTRYVSSGSCVHCTIEQAKESQRRRQHGNVSGEAVQSVRQHGTVREIETLCPVPSIEDGKE